MPEFNLSVGIFTMSLRRVLQSLFTILLVSLLLIRAAHAAPRDFDADGLEDLALFDPSSSSFRVRFSSRPNSPAGNAVGPRGNVPAISDFNNDGVGDQASFNRSNGTWSFLLSDGRSFDLVFGSPGDLPVPSFYSGFPCTDLATFNPQTARWTISNCGVFGPPRFENFGLPGDIPVPGRYDSDNLDDLAVVDPATMTWRIRGTRRNRTSSVQFGLPGDIPIPGNYIGGSTWELAVFRPVDKRVYVSHQGTVFSFPAPSGIFGDRPIVFDVEGDGLVDLTSFHPTLQSVDISSSTLLSFSGVPLGVTSLGAFAASNPGVDFNTPAPSLYLPARSTQYQRGAVEGDFDRDLRSDFVFTRTANGLTQWVIQTAAGATYSFEFGFASDTILAGDTDGDLREEPVAVRNRGDGGIDWYVRRPDGSASRVFFGFEDDQVVLGDFDCDGKDDYTVVRENGAGLEWFTRPTSERFEDLGRASQTSFGLVGDTVFAADMNGDGCDEIVVAQEFAGGIWWYWKSLLTDEFGAMPWGLAGSDRVLSPMDFDGDRKADPVVERTVGEQRTAFIRTSSGQARVVELGKTGTAFTGFFNGLTTAEVAVHIPEVGSSPARARVYRADGFAGDVILDKSLPTDVHIVPGSAGVLAETLPEITEVQCDIVGSFEDGPSGRLWKPFSDNTRQPVFLMPRSYWETVQSIEVFAADGTFLLSGGRRVCCPNGGRAHFDVREDPFELNEFAPLTVRLNFRDGGNECLGVPDATQRYD